MRKNYINKTPNSKIKIIFNTNDGSIISQNYFDINTKLKNIFSYFDNNFSNKGYKLKEDYKLSNKKISSNNTIYDLLISKSNSKNILNNSEIYIEVSQNINIENEEIYNTILFPKLNPFELIEYNSLNNKLRYIKCPGQTLNFCSLYKFSKESAFCNSENDLFLSGGLYNGKTLNFFWIINKKNFQILKKTMPIFKKYHSMLYIPDNFVLITGGDTLSSYIYDIENKQFIRWAPMNKKHFQPGLIIVGDYAYAFSSLNDKKEENNYFEKTDLTSKNPKWEKIYPLFDIYGIKNDFYSLHFAVVKKNEDEILIIGGEKNKNRYVYNTIVNKIYLTEKNNYEISFWDKTFYDINNKYKLGIPLSFSQEHTLYLLNKQNENLVKAIYSSNTKNNNDNSYDILIDNHINEEEEGIIIIKNKDDLDNYDLNNDINNNNDDILEEEIIFTEDFSKKNEDIKLSKNKEHNKKEHLFLPNYIIIEQFIDRELNLSNEKEINNSKEKENDYIIYEVYEEKKDDNEKVIKRENRHNYLYIPNSIIDDQIVNRQIILSNKNNDIQDVKNNNEEIIYIESNQKFNDEEENKNKYSTYKKPYIKKEIFYIPNSSLEEQIIQRDLLKFKRKKKNIELIQKNNEDIDIYNNNQINNDEILINYNNEEEKENEINKTNSQCPLKKTNILYVPMSSFDEQILNRVVNTINNEDNENNTKPLIKRKIYKIKLDNEINDEMLKENEIINEVYNEDNINNNGKYFIIKKNKAKIYIPQNIIEEQFINREVKEN